MAIRHRLLVARRVPQDVGAAARERFDATLAEHNLTDQEVVELAARDGAQGLLMGGNLTLDARTVERLPDGLRVIATTSVGTDHIDVAAAALRGIVVTNVPDVGIECTADLTFMLILTACRRAHEYNALMRAGWGRRLGFDEMLGLRVSGRTLGIVGMGRIGRLVARRAAAFDMPVHYTDVAPSAEADAAGAVYHASIDTLLPATEVLTLHLPDLPSTRRILTADRIARLRRGAVVVNAARGSLIDYEALITALEGGHLAAAGLDTFPDEPRVDPRLAAMPNIFLTPHAGSATCESRSAICLRCLDNIAAVLNGVPPLNPVTPQPAAAPQPS